MRKYYVIYNPITQVEVEVHPVGDNDLHLELELEEGEWYAREKLSSRVKLQNDYANNYMDFNTARIASYEQEYKFIIRESSDNYASIRWQGYFFQNDGIWDLDTCSVELDIHPDDAYRQLIEAMEDEYYLSEFTDKKTVYRDETAIIEEIRISFIDTYQSTRRYWIGERVIYEGLGYRCKLTSLDNIPTNTIFWYRDEDKDEESQEAKLSYVLANYGEKWASDFVLHEKSVSGVYYYVFRRLALSFKASNDWVAYGEKTIDLNDTNVYRTIDQNGVVQDKKNYWIGPCTDFGEYVTTQAVRIYYNSNVSLLEIIEFIIDDISNRDVVSDFFTNIVNPLTTADNLYNNVYLGQVKDYKEYKQEDSVAGTVTLQGIFEWLKRIFNVYWYIDDNGDVVLEHYFFFENGLSYTGDPTVGYDLTTLYPTWLEGTNKIEYEKQELYSKEKWSWLFAISQDFVGKDIIYGSPARKRDKKEPDSIEYALSDISTDIPGIAAKHSEVPDEGFVMVSCEGPVTSILAQSYWENIDFDTFTASGQTITSAIKTQIIHKAMARIHAPITLLAGLTYDITVTLDSTSGPRPYIYFANEVDEVEHIFANSSAKVQLANGVNNIRLKADIGGSAYLYIEITSEAEQANFHTDTTFGISYTTRAIRNNLGKLSQEYIYNADLAIANLHDKLFRHGRPLKSGNMNGADESFVSAIRIKMQKGVQFPLCSGELTIYDLAETDIGVGRIKKAIFRHDGVIDVDLDFTQEKPLKA